MMTDKEKEGNQELNNRHGTGAIRDNSRVQFAEYCMKMNSIYTDRPYTGVFNKIKSTNDNTQAGKLFETILYILKQCHKFVISRTSYSISLSIY